MTFADIGRKFAFALIAAAIATEVAAHSPERAVTQGLATEDLRSLPDCRHVPGGRVVRIGAIRSTEGSRWTVPADVHSGPVAIDLYNECTDHVPRSLADVQLDDVPIVTVDEDGEVITGYLLADNYFELYVNGKLVAIDSTVFTPFNSAVVRFRAKRPITYAVTLVDWEENLGVGTEQDLRGPGLHHPGDGGFLARFSDGTITDATWRAQTFYIAPLASPSDVREAGAVRDTSHLGRTYPSAKSQAACAERCYAVHYRIPPDWTSPAFDASQWPAASEFTHQQMGAERLNAYTNFRDAFGNARVIWSSNLVYDNLVLARKVVP